MRWASSALVAVIVMVGSPAVADHTFKKIKETKTIHLGYEIAPPFSARNEENVPFGYSIELCHIIVAGLRQQLAIPDLQIQWTLLESDARIDSVADGTVDLVCGNVTDTLSREEKVDFSHLIYVGGGGVLVAAASGITSIEQLVGKRIAVMPKTSNKTALEQYIARSGKPTKVIDVNDHAEGIAIVESGGAEGYVTDRVVLIGMLSNKFKNNVMVLDQYFSYEPIALPMRNNDPSFRLAVNGTLARLYRTTQVNDLVRKWLAPTGKQDPLLTSMFLLNSRPE